MTNEVKIDLAFALIRGLVELFKRHQQGENVTADLDDLLEKTNALKTKEQLRAEGVMPTVVESKKNE